MRYSPLVIGCLLAALTGCGSTSPNEAGPDTTPTEASSEDTAVGKLLGLKRVASADLPTLAPHLSANLDEGRLRVAAPEGWLVRPRSQDYLALFVVDAKSSFPRIVVKRGDDAEAMDTSALTDANVEDYAKSLAEKFDDAGRKIVEIRPLVIGDLPCVRYVVFGKSNLNEVETQHLTTVVGGRVYDVQLTAYRQTTESEPPITKHRDHAYAVFAGLQFVPADEAVDAPAASQTSPE